MSLKASHPGQARLCRSSLFDSKWATLDTAQVSLARCQGPQNLPIARLGHLEVIEHRDSIFRILLSFPLQLSRSAGQLDCDLDPGFLHEIAVAVHHPYDHRGSDALLL